MASGPCLYEGTPSSSFKMAIVIVDRMSIVNPKTQFVTWINQIFWMNHCGRKVLILLVHISKVTFVTNSIIMVWSVEAGSTSIFSQESKGLDFMLI